MTINGSELTRTFLETHDKSTEAKSIIYRLTEEKAGALHQSNRLRQELELLRRDINKSRSGGVSFMFVIVVGMIGVVLGYILKS